MGFKALATLIPVKLYIAFNPAKPLSKSIVLQYHL